MNWVTIIWAMVASACLTMALPHLLIGIWQRRATANLFFVLAAVAVAGIAVGEYAIMTAQTPEQIGKAQQWAHVPVFVLVVAIVGFVRLYFGTGRLWLGVGGCVARAVSLVINFALPPNLNFRHVVSVRHVEFLGQTVSAPEGVRSSWTRLGELSSLLVLAFVVDASVALWRQGTPESRRRAVVVGGSVTVFILMAAGIAALINAQVIHWPYLVSLPFLGIIVAMGFELSYDVLRAGVLARELQASESSLRESEERFRIVADAAPVLIWMAGVDKLCTFFNKPWLGFTGRSMEQEMGNGWAEGVHPDDLQKCLKLYSEAFDARKAFVMQYRLRRYDGEYRWISDQGVARYDSNGKFSGYIGSCVDITDLIKKDEALREFEERVVLAAEATHHGVWEMDLVTNELWMSDKARALFQFDPEARLDEAIVQRRIHPDDRALRESAIKQAIETEGEYALEYRVLLPDGTLHWISGRGRCLTGKHGKGKRLIGVSVDITQQKEAQDLFRLAAEGSHLGVWHWDEVAKTLTWDRATRDMFGVSADAEITIDTFYRALHPDDAERVKQTWRQALELRLPYQIEFRTQRTDGTIRWVDARGRGYYDEAGKPLWMTGVLFDITDRKEAELEALQNRDELSHLSRVAAMGELAASIAHELNQPLSGITSNAAAGQRFIDRGKVDLRELHDLLGDIVADGHRAGDVIRGIQSMVKKDVSAHRRINLNDIVISVVRMVKPSAMLHSCELGTFLDSDLPMVEADPVQLQQVLLNLIINAFDAMRDTPLSRRKVVIATERDADGVTRTSVRDYGVGIPTEARERLFEQFFTTKTKGLGMGLSIVRSIVESHGGTVTAENCEGAGAQFSFTLPASAKTSAV